MISKIYKNSHKKLWRKPKSNKKFRRKFLAEAEAVCKALAEVEAKQKDPAKAEGMKREQLALGILRILDNFERYPELGALSEQIKN